MAIRNILRSSDPSLKKKSRTITDFNKRLHELLDDMRETLLAANGLGLAAPQVGVLRRAALIVDISSEDEDGAPRFIEMINPEILAKSGEQSGLEGCLSMPGLYGEITRPEIVKIKAQDRFGAVFELMCKELTARALIDPKAFTFGLEQLSMFTHDPIALALPEKSSVKYSDVVCDAVEETILCLTSIMA